MCRDNPERAGLPPGSASTAARIDFSANDQFYWNDFEPPPRGGRPETVPVMQNLIHNDKDRRFDPRSTASRPEPRCFLSGDLPAQRRRCPTRRASWRQSRVTAGALVEVNGIEPMTSCLQSRRSPSI